MTRPLCYIIRHGQTDWNAERRLQGQADRDINETGCSQASANGARLKELVSDPSLFDFVSSPMLRTRHTMQRLRTAMGLDPNEFRTDARLKEIHFGDWQGFTFAELEATTPGLREARNLDKWHFVPPGDGAESYEMLRQRVGGWFNEVTQPTICVAHGGIIRSLFRLLDQIDEDTAAYMDIPQDRILRLKNDRLSWI